MRRNIKQQIVQKAPKQVGHTNMRSPRALKQTGHFQKKNIYIYIVVIFKGNRVKLGERRHRPCRSPGPLQSRLQPEQLRPPRFPYLQPRSQALPNPSPGCA